MTKEECPLCVISQKRGKDIRMLYEDSDIIAFLYPTAALGHVCIIPKKHVPIFMQCDEKVTGKMFEVAQKLAKAVNIPLEANSSNLVINTGVDQAFSHLSLHILPRKAGDNINIQWEPKQVPEEELNSIEQKLARTASPAEEKKAEKREISEEYYQRYLRRIP